MLNSNDIWKLKDMIKCGIINHNVGDRVVIFRRKSNNCKRIKDNVNYKIKGIEGDNLVISDEYNQERIVIHKTYMITRESLRDFKLSKII